MHKITEVDTETKTGVCSICGPVSLFYKTGKPRARWMCLNKRKENKRKSHSRKYFGKDTAEIRLNLFKLQNELCAICSVSIGLYESHLDHDHTTNEIRGLLCPGCNTGLGLFKDSPENLIAAAAYLQNAASLFGGYT